MRFLTIAACLMLLAVSSRIDAKSWRGVVPLKSNRANVIKLLGNGNDARNPGARYSLQNEYVDIIYSGKDQYFDCVNQLPSDLVLQIRVINKLPLAFNDLRMNPKTLLTVGPSMDAPLRSQGFIDDKGGTVVSVREGYVQQVVYLPTKAERTRCPSYYANLARFIHENGLLCPAISLDCPDSIEAGDKIKFTAYGFVGYPPLTYKWTVNEGTIVEGQGTASITVDTGKLADKTVTATLEIDGVEQACPRTASCATTVNPKRN